MFHHTYNATLAVLPDFLSKYLFILIASVKQAILFM